jgi:hypothetical protein
MCVCVHPHTCTQKAPDPSAGSLLAPLGEEGVGVAWAEIFLREMGLEAFMAITARWLLLPPQNLSKFPPN